LDIAQNNLADTTTGNSNNILVPNGRSSVTVGGADWGAADATATNHNIIALPAYDAFAGTGRAGTENASILDNAVSSTTGNYTIQTLKIAPNGGGGSLTLGTGNVLTLNAGGLLLASTTGSYSITGGQIKAGQNPGDLILLANGASMLTVGSTIVNNSTYTSRITTAGTGTFATALATNGASAAIGSTTAGGVTVAGGGTINMYDTKIGTLSLNSPAGSTLTVGSGGAGPSMLDFDFDGASADLIILSSNFTVGANGALINVSGLSATGNFPLISYPAGVKNGAGALTLGTTPPPVFGLTYSLTTDAHTVYFSSIGYIPQAAYWRGNISSTWNDHASVNTNWTEDLAGATPLTNALPGATTNVYFAANNVNIGVLTTTLGQDMGILSLNFNTNVGPTRPVTINGSNKLTIGMGGITIDSGSGAHTIATSQLVLNGSQWWTNNSTSAFTVTAPITGGDPAQTLNLSGNGVFVFNEPNTFASPHFSHPY
jgi:hypothetical protein